MKSFISSLILTGALWVSIPMSAQRPMNERVHDKVATKEAPRIQFVGKKTGTEFVSIGCGECDCRF